MRASCNKKEDNFITYHSTREKIIERTREWEKLNPEKRKEYTIKYYKTEKGHRKRLAQQKRYREKKKLIKELEKLKNDKMELLAKVDILEKENKELKNKLTKEEILCFNMPERTQVVCLTKPNYERNKLEYETLDKYKSVIDKAIEYIKYNATSNYFDKNINMFRREADLLEILRGKK